MYRDINKYRKKKETIVGPKIWKHSQFVYFPCFEITLVLHQLLPCLFSQAFLCVSHQPLGGVGEAMKWPLLTSLSPHGPQYSNNMSNRHFLSVWKSKYRSLVWLGCGENVKTLEKGFSYKMCCFFVLCESTKFNVKSIWKRARKHDWNSYYCGTIACGAMNNPAFIKAPLYGGLYIHLTHETFLVRSQ